MQYLHVMLQERQAVGREDWVMQDHRYQKSEPILPLPQLDPDYVQRTDLDSIV
jgi:hypothetical protein